MIRFDVDKRSVSYITSYLNRIKLVLRGGASAMMKEIGELMEQQHTRRITSEKTSPDGAAWKANIRGTSILYKTGALASGFKSSSSMFTVTLGPPGLPYSFIQEAGGTMTGNPYMIFSVNGGLIHAKKAKVPARPYMGISPQNWLEISQLVDRHMSRMFGWL
jgi:phage gpG-like protein